MPIVSSTAAHLAKHCSALRVGYLILPPALVDVFLAARRFIDIHPPQLQQAVLAAFISEGHFGRHLRRMRNLYAERRATLLPPQ